MEPIKVICFGEILLRMSPALGGAWLDQATMPVYVGGSEANVACALAAWKQSVGYCTAIPDHYLGREMAAYLEEKGVDTRTICWTGNRVGTYYLPQGTDLQHAGVIYDRAYSSFAELRPGMVDWDTVFQDAGWFHFSAISPGLNHAVAAVCQEALKTASKKGMIISVDLNYRTKLWQYGADPIAIMSGLLEYCDVVMGNIWAAQSLLGIAVEPHIHENAHRQRYLEHARRTSEAIVLRFPRSKKVSLTFRFEQEGQGLRYYGTLYDRATLHVSREYASAHVVDKVGSGDCFMGGLIHGISEEWPSSRVIDFAAAAAIGKLQEPGDATCQTVAQIQNIIERHVP